MGLKFEAWTLPTAATFQKKFDISEALPGATGVRELSAWTDASLPVPSSWGRIDDLIAEDDASLIAVYDRDASGNKVLVDEFIAQRCPFSTQRPGTRTISGPGINGIVEKCAVYAYNDSVDDWIWGSDKNLLSNAGLEENVDSPTVWQLEISATGGTFTLTDGTDTTSAIAFDAQAGTIATRLESDIAALTDVIITGDAATGIITLVDPPFGVSLSINTGSLTGGTGTLTLIDEGEADPSPWTNARNLTIPENTDIYETFEVSTEQANSGIRSLKVDPRTILPLHRRGPGIQQSVTVKPGQTYRTSGYIHPTSATDKFRLAVATYGDGVVGRTTGTALTTGTFTQQELTVTIPDGVDQVLFRTQWTNVPATGNTYNPSAAYFDDFEFLEGLPATTADDIVRTLLQAAQARGTFGFLEVDALAGEDSLGNALSDISFIARYGQDLGHVLNGLSLLGINWRVVRADQALAITPAGTTTHVLQLFDAGEVPVDHTASAGGPSILGGDATVVKRIPDYTAVRARGAGDLYVDDTNTTALANMGRWEKIIDAEDVASAAALQLLIDHRFAEEDLNQKAASATVLYTDQSRPGVQYDAGDRIWWQLPGILPKESRVVKRWSWTYGDQTTYEVQGSKVLGGQAGLAQAVDYLLRQFTRRAQEPRPSTPAFGGGAGGAFTIQIAAADALDIEKDKADMLCTGSSSNRIDGAVIQQANQIIAQNGSGGKIVLSSGTFYVNPGEITLASDMILEGVNQIGTVINAAVNTSGTIIDCPADVVIRDLSIVGWNFAAPSIGIKLGNGSRVENVNFSAMAVGVEPGNQCVITGCYVSSSLPIFVDGADGYQSVQVVNNSEITTVVGGSSSFHVNGWVIADNTFQGQIIMENCDGFTISGNEWIAGDGTSAAIINVVDCFGGTVTGNTAHYSSGLDALILNACRGVSVVGNQFDYLTAGILVTGSSFCTVAKNILGEADEQYVGEHGIEVTNSSNCVVVGNTVVSVGQDTDNTFDGIILTGDSNDNVVALNKVFPAPSAGTQTRYGINISASTCNNNAVFANYLGDSSEYGTADSVDSGTGTQTTPSAGAIGGQWAY